MQRPDPDLPDELQAQASDDLEARQQRLDTLSMLVARKRDEAVAGRAASGIEQIWQEDEDSYEGFDEANRTESRVVKASTPAGGLTRQQPTGGTRSTMFLNITRPYVDAAAARVSDMLLPTDDRAFEIKPEPVPELTARKDDKAPAIDPATGQPLMKEAQGEDGQPMQAPATHADLAQQLLDSAQASAEKAQTRIDDWLVECGYHAEKRKAIHDCAKMGTCVLKGPFPVKRTSKAVSQTAAGVELAIQQAVKPASKRIDVWNFYPDPACGESIHDGNYCLERDYLTDRQLKALIGVPGYLEAQIVQCLKDADQHASATTRAGRDRKNLHEVWYYYGSIDACELKAAGCDMGDKTGQAHYAVVTMVGDRVIKAALNHLDSGEFPYDVMPWQVMAGSWTGIGVARQIRAAQGMIVAGSRNMMDNAALSGGPILGINRSMLEPADGNWALSPRKIFYTTADAEGVDIRTAIASFDIPSKQQELMAIIQFALKMAEEVTGLPMLLQGQTGNAPDTLGGQIMANNNASTVLRRIARLDDDYITRPHIRRYYEYLLIYGPEEGEKGQFTVDVRGSSVLVERDIQNHATIAMLQLSTNPAFGADPKKAFAEACRVQRLDPKRFQFSPEDLAKMQQQPPPEAPAVQVAKLNVQKELQKQDMADKTALQIAQSRDQLIAHKTEIDTDRDKALVDSMERRDAAAADARMRALEIQERTAQLNYDIKLMEFAKDERISLSEAKVRLSSDAMKLTVQKQLAAMDGTAPELIKPAMEPRGRAENGKAFQQ